VTIGIGVIEDGGVARGVAIALGLSQRNRVRKLAPGTRESPAVYRGAFKVERRGFFEAQSNT
jgi:hypothetical protein